MKSEVKILRRKSQISVEVMLSLALVLIFFIFLIFYSQKEQRYVTNLDSYLDELGTCTKLASVTTKVFQMGDGASIQLIVEHYTELDLDNKKVYIKGGLRESICHAPVIFDYDFISTESKSGLKWRTYPPPSTMEVSEIESMTKIKIENVDNKIQIEKI